MVLPMVLTPFEELKVFQKLKQIHFETIEEDPVDIKKRWLELIKLLWLKNKAKYR